MIAHWLRTLGLIHEFRMEEIAEGPNLYRAVVRTTPRGAEVGLTEVGFGVSQVLPARVLLYYVPEGATVILEQPRGSNGLALAWWVRCHHRRTDTTDSDR